MVAIAACALVLALPGVAAALFFACVLIVLPGFVIHRKIGGMGILGGALSAAVLGVAALLTGCAYSVGTQGLLGVDHALGTLLGLTIVATFAAIFAAAGGALVSLFLCCIIIAASGEYKRSPSGESWSPTDLNRWNSV
jgi:hypothetical protein